MIYLILTCLVLVGIVGYQWTEIQVLRQQVDDLEDWTAELDPVEVDG
jgi:hypothetical protein